MEALLRKIRDIFRLLGIDFYKFPHGFSRRKKELLNTYDINVIIDVGANSGQYATEIRKVGYKGRIISFEPIKTAFNELQSRAKRDGNWSVYNMGLGNEDKTLELNIAGNSFSSSFLEMKQEHISAAPDSSFINKEKITVKRLDSLYKGLSIDNTDRVLLKLDVQGFEKNVLEGAGEILNLIKGIELEMSIIELYNGETTYKRMTEIIEAKGFTLCAIESGFYNSNTGQLLQMDGLFYRLKQ